MEEIKLLFESDEETVILFYSGHGSQKGLTINDDGDNSVNRPDNFII